MARRRWFLCHSFQSELEMNDLELKQAYDRDGFVIVRQFLPADEFALLNRELDRYIGQVVPTLPDKHAFYEEKSRPQTLKQLQHMEVDSFFQEYAGDARWARLASLLVGEEANCKSTEWFNKPAGTTHPTPAHQDNFYFNYAPPNVLTMWLALDDVDEENGCLRYVPGSHLEGRRPHSRSNVLGFSQGISDYSPADLAREQLMILQPNDLIVHHGWTIHRAEPNRSQTRERRSFAMVFKGVSCGVDAEGYRRYEEQMLNQHRELGLKV